MNFYKLIKEIDIEHSSVCNAACPQCTRELRPKDYSWFKQTWLSEEFYENSIPQEVYDNLESIFFSGMVGDPCAAPNFLEVCKIIKRKAPHIRIKVSTNGGMRNPEWWLELGKILNKGSYVRFAIDGLEDTNHIYRINVQWSKLIQNVKAFIQAGGETEWQWIVFKHNEHQVDEAKNFSLKIGIDRFIVRKSHKFLLDALFEMQYNSKGIPIEIPTQEKYIHPLILQNKRIFKLDEALEVSDTSPITCQAQDRKAIYISAEGYLFPCVYTGTCMHLYKNKSLGDNWIELWDNYGKEKINLKNNSWNDIINGEFFNKIQTGWNCNYSSGRLAACGLFCSSASSRIFDSCVEYDVTQI